MHTSITMMMIMLLATLTPLSKSIISLGALLLSTALLTTILVSQTINSWFAFILFLIYITGLLVLFSYMMAMSPNTYYTQKKTTKILFITMATIITPLLVKMPTLIMNPMNGEKTFEQNVTQLFSSNNIPMYWLIGMVLLIALVMAVTICYKSAKPLRSYI